MKKIFMAMTLAIMCVFALAACQDKGSSSAATSSSASATTETSSIEESTSSVIDSSSSIDESSSTEETSTSTDATEIVTNTLDLSTSAMGSANITYTEPTTYGKFTVMPVNEYEAGNQCIKTTNASTLTEKSIKIVIDGPGSIFTRVKSASGSITATSHLSLCDETGTEVKYFEFGLNNGGSGVLTDYTFTNVEAGTYFLMGPKSIRIYALSTTATVEVSPINGFEIASTGTVDYLEGSAYDASKLQVNATYASGKTDALTAADYTVDSSAYNATIPGTYTISVSYATYEAKTFTVTVYEAVELELNMYIINKVNNMWGNGSYNKAEVPTTFLQGATFSSDNLTVKIIGEDGEGKQKLFTLSSSAYTVNSTAYQANVAGTYAINVSSTVNSKVLSSSYNVSVVTAEESIISNVVYVVVNPNYAGIKGAVVTTESTTVTVENSNVFTTVSDALQFLVKSAIPDSTEKMMYLMDGTYNEKIDVTIPNLTMVGESEAGVVITYDAYNGATDAVGTSFSTDGSATFSVRDTANNFKAKNITFESYYNTLERYTALKATTSGTQALAVMIQADMTVFENCTLTGFQDTLELQGEGRQYFQGCTIVGATDFIFGTNSSAYFYQCEIKTIGNGQSDNGGYIFAPKGINKGGDPTAYGYVCNQCTFTNDGTTTAGTTAICRPWDVSATITIMNSVLGDHISTAGYTAGATKGQRYVGGLNSNATPLTATIKFQEYNNTGAGAITTAVAGMTMLDETAALNILANVFGPWTVAAGSTYEFTCTAWTPVLPLDYQFATVKS